MAGAAKPKIDAETQFLDMIYRLKKSHEGFCAVFFRLSIIKPSLRTETRIGQIVSMFNALTVQMRPFFMADGDAFLIAQDLPKRDSDILAKKVRALFKQDMKSDSEDFIVRYELDKSYDDVLKLAQEKEEDLRNRRREKAKKVATVPIEPKHLDAVLKNIRHLNVFKVIRRQEAIEITKTGAFESLFFEYINSIFDLKQAVAPTVDMLSNRWLFQYLTETLDRRMLAVSNGILEHTPKGISLNLNISSIFSDEFKTFVKSKPETLTVYAEVQLMDIIQNTDNYFKALEKLHRAGCKLCIDGVPPISLEFLDIARFNADYLKLIWSPSLVSYQGKKGISELVADIGPEKFILSRAEGEESIEWGLKQGITRFQGYFIDSLSGAATRRHCLNRNMCTLAQCISRKGCIAGPVWSQCMAKELLDSPMEKNLTR